MAYCRSGRRRAQHDIITEILEFSRKGTPKTRIMYKVRLSFVQLKKYLGALERAGLIENESGVWRTTESGINVIEACRICRGLINELALGENNE